MTLLSTIFDKFLSKITDDMYMEPTPEQTWEMRFELFENALPWFEFPRFDLYAYDLATEEYSVDLTAEEIDSIATYMVVEWFKQQLANVDITRLKYSGDDFKFTSQANHMSKLKANKDGFLSDAFHLQRLYKRRKRSSDGTYKSTFGSIMDNSVRGN
jgi:hypothetical protein